MATRNFMKRPSGSREPKAVGAILDEMLRGDSLFAVAYRKHASRAESKGETDLLFKNLHPDTFLCVDLKVMRNEPGRMPVSEMLGGTLIRNGEESFTFIQDIIEKKGDYARNPHVYSGKHINVVRKKDGELWLTFNRPRYTEKFTFQDLCREAAKELLTIAGLVKKK